MLTLLGAISLFMVVFGGVMWISSAGNKDTMMKGIKMIKWAMAGIFVAIFAFIIISFVFTDLMGGGVVVAPTEENSEPLYGICLYGGDPGYPGPTEQNCVDYNDNNDGEWVCRTCVPGKRIEYQYVSNLCPGLNNNLCMNTSSEKDNDPLTDFLWLLK